MFGRKPPTPVAEDVSLLPAILAVIVCWAVPALLYLWENNDKDSAKFALLELVGCAIGNGLVAAMPILWSEAEWAMLLLIWLLFMILYFPAGGHFNSALTAGASAAGQCSFLLGALFIGSQVIGSGLGVELTRLVSDSKDHDKFAPVDPSYVETSPYVAVGFEVFCSVLMVLVQLGIFQKFDKHFVLASTGVVVLTKATGAFMDPLGPTSAAFFARDTSHLQIGWAGGLVGGFIAGRVWRDVLKMEEAEAPAEKKTK